MPHSLQTVSYTHLVSPEEAEDIAIAGMGGELILRIITRAPWLRDPQKRLILQPMSSVPELRLGLRDLGFAVLQEEAVEDLSLIHICTRASVWMALSVRISAP